MLGYINEYATKSDTQCLFDIVYRRLNRHMTSQSECYEWLWVSLVVSSTDDVFL